MPRPRLAPALAAALALAIAGCSGSPAPTPVTTSPDGGATVVVGQNGIPRYVTPGAVAGQEDQVTVAAGATVTWRFVTTGYNVVSGGGTPDAGCVPDDVFCSPADQNCTGAVPPQAAGSIYQRTFQAVGDYPYFSQPGCLQGMTGTVHVTPSDGGADGGVDGGP
jgi:plastocyanin